MQASRSDAYEAILNRFNGSSFTPEEVAMALTATGSSNPDEQEVHSHQKLMDIMM